MSDGTALNYDRYLTGGAVEWLLRIGEPSGPPILFVPPLLEEMNRTRALIVAVMRLLAGRGHGCWLIDLPGSGESERPLETCSWADWQRAAADAGRAVANASGNAPHVASLRGGALLDGAIEAASCWRFAPAAGRSLVRDLERASRVAAGDQSDSRLELAGYALAPELIDPLRDAAPTPVEPLRTVRLASDPGDAELKLEGPALWRRSEPGTSPELAAALAADLTLWTGRCAAS